MGSGKVRSGPELASGHGLRKLRTEPKEGEGLTGLWPQEAEHSQSLGEL